MLNKKDHGFRYYTSDHASRGGGPRTSTLPGPILDAQARTPSPAQAPNRVGSNRGGGGGGVVRVAAGAGDKCVAPAKSKPKKRKAVKEGDGPTIGMECVEWSDDQYNVAQLVSAFGRQLPIIVKSTAVHAGNHGTQLAPDQVLQIHSYGRQKRVKARFVKGGKLSIPLEYPMEIYVKEGSTGERWKLKQAMEVKKLPLKAQVISTYGQIEEPNVKLVGEELKLQKVEEEVFLRANYICDGWIDQNNVALIPANAVTSFKVAVGMLNASRAECDDYFGMFARSVRHLNFELLTGLPGLNIEDAPPSARSSAVPSIYQDMQAAAVYENVQVKRPPIKQESAPDPAPNVYENVPRETKKSSSASSGNPDIRHIQVDDRTYAQINHLSRTRDSIQDQVKRSEEIVINTPPVPPKAGPSSHVNSPRGEYSRPETPFSEMDGEDLQEMFMSVVSLVEEQDKLEEERQRSLQRGEATEHQVVVETHVPPAGHHAPVLQSYANPAFQPDQAQPDKKKKVPPKVEKKPTKQVKNGQNMEFKNVCSKFALDAETYPRTGSSSDDPTGRDRINVGRVSSKRNENSQYTPKAVVQPTIQNSHSPAVTGNIVKVTITENDSVNSPVTKSPDKKAASQHRISGHSGSNIERIEDVPDGIEGLTVEDICQCLRLLNMDGHIKHFHKHQVDGNLLSDMKEKVLIDEFKFTPFNASKLMRFARGWRPKLL